MDYTEFENLKGKIIEYLKASLKTTRLEHTRSVARLAVEMAQKYDADIQKTEIAALLHDMARNIGVPATNMYIKALNLPDEYMDNVNLAHSKIGAALAKSEFNISDQEILDAISYHTTGKADMSTLEKIIFLADAIEPLRDYNGVDKIREKAEESLDSGCLASLGRTIEFLEGKGVFIDRDTIEAFNYLKENIK